MKILIPIDIAHPHEDLVKHVSWLLPLAGAEVKLVYVKESYPAHENVIYSVPGFPDDWVEQIEDKARLAFELIVRQLTPLGCKVTTAIVSGVPAKAIGAVSTDFQADITVVAPGHHSNLERFFLGSVTSKVVRVAPGNIMVLKDHDGHDELKHVVFGVDGSMQALSAIKNVCQILKLKERSVKTTVVYVVSLPPVVSMVSPAGVLVTVEKNLQMAGEAVVAAAVKQLADCGIDDANIDCQVLTGDAATKLISFTEERDAQLLVAGAQGHAEIEYFFLGSVADRVATHSKCSVTIAKMSRS